MATTPPKNDSRLGKGYSYLFALLLIAVLASQLVNLQLKTNRAGEFEWAVSTREISVQIFYPCVLLIAGILGLPTDAIALAFGQFLTKGRD
ncbi:hypothetical protein [Nostoc sp. JL23]|uniref:hypothetical protein n=1 Tax=Nostoc sp. JL23 TaxID=2815394 RepID=UPI001D89CC4B|nr:hypothetical protein [Nostoc sp. JL23]MBN3875191.1 hypothetical protein [Nostoc sp. JL23]